MLRPSLPAPLPSARGSPGGSLNGVLMASRRGVGDPLVNQKFGRGRGGGRGKEEGRVWVGGGFYFEKNKKKAWVWGGRSTGCVHREPFPASTLTPVITYHCNGPMSTAMPNALTFPHTHRSVAMSPSVYISSVSLTDPQPMIA